MMVDFGNKLLYFRLFNEYPIVDNKQMPDLKMERAKMVLVANVIHKTIGLDEDMVLRTMCDIRGLSYDTLPNLIEACKTTNVTLDFLNDYNKIQYLFEYNNKIMTEFPRYLMNVNTNLRV